MKTLWLIMLLPLSAFCQAKLCLAKEMVVRQDTTSPQLYLRFDGAHTHQILEFMANWQDIVILYKNRKPHKTINGEYPLKDFICILEDLKKNDPTFKYCITSPTDKIKLMYIYKQRKHWWQFYRVKDEYSFLGFDRKTVRDLRTHQVKLYDPTIVCENGIKKS